MCDSSKKCCCNCHYINRKHGTPVCKFATDKPLAFIYKTTNCENYTERDWSYTPIASRGRKKVEKAAS